MKPLKITHFWFIVCCFALLSLLLAKNGQASLYCVVDFGGKRCHFSDLVACKKAAGTQGNCILNRNAVIAPTGGSPFCLVKSWQTECIYRDKTSCEKIAAHRNEICIANPNLMASPIPENSTNRPTYPNDKKTTKPRQDDYLPSPGYQPHPGFR